MFDNKVVMITGAGQGIGKEISLEFAKNGATVAILDRNQSALENTKKEIEIFGGKCKYFVGDISNYEICETVVNKIIKEFSKIDILVNNAGIMKRTSTLETTNDEWLNVIDVNLNAVFYLSRLVLSKMKSMNSGNIINITSANGVTPHPNAAPSYGASKAAVTYLTRHFSMEFSKYGIRVNAVQCGPISSRMADQWSEEYRRKSLGKIPLSRLGTPQDVASAVLFLASDKSSFITGTSLNVSGGKLMY
jgi:3-oxoacyl-[acyl-carrier protein] reductase